MKKFILKSMGCKSNQFEGQIVAERLVEAGYEEVKKLEDADFYVLNSCSVTHKSDNEAMYLLRHAKNLGLKTILTGCVAQIEKEKLLDLSYIDYVFGNEDKFEIVSHLQNEENFIVRDLMSETEFYKISLNDTTKTRISLKIQDGCDNRCAYCIIPYVRGRIRSKNKEDVINEVSKLVSEGYKEIVLTGIHTGRYGIDINSSLEELLYELVKIPGIYRIRLSSIEINEITPGIIELLKNNKVMAKHLHIPIQSGSDKILKLMNRRYNKNEFIDMVNVLKEIDDISLTTDLIVGFPNEEDSDFEETIDTLKKIGFTKIHTFPYSKRKGTPASVMDKQVLPVVKKNRVHKIIDLSSEYEEKYYKSKIGMVYDGVVEVHNSGEVIVHTSNFIPVIVDNSNIKNNTIVNVEIIRADNLKVYGKIVYI